MKNLAVAALAGGLFLVGCAQKAGEPVVTLSGAQAEAGAILNALEAGAAVYTSAASTAPAEVQDVENVMAPAKAAVAAFQAAQANETPTALAETASQDITAVLAVLPIAAQTMDPWDAPSQPAGDYQPGSWGGHAVPIVGHGPSGLVCVTWGTPKRITWRFWNAYASEAYGLLSRDFVTGSGNAAAIDWAQLAADMADLRVEAA